MEDNTAGAVMRREIWEQPSALGKLDAACAPILREVAERAKGASYAVLAARGSSDNASTYGKYLLEGLAGMPTALAAPSLFSLYHTPPRLKNALVIGVSQSGQAADVVQVLAEARKQGAITLAVTNTADSPITAAAEYRVLLNAGLEHALAATKTVTAQCAVYAWLASNMANDTRLQQKLRELPTALDSLLAKSDAIANMASSWLESTRTSIIGRGYTYGAAQEIALKLKETCYIGAEPYSAADFLHGPLAIVEADYPVLMLLNHDATLPSATELMQRVRERGGKVMVFATERAALQINHDTPTLVIDSPDPLLTTIPAIVAGQVFAMHLAVAKGYNPDVSRGLRKVTITL